MPTYRFRVHLLLSVTAPTEDEAYDVYADILLTTGSNRVEIVDQELLDSYKVKE